MEDARRTTHETRSTTHNVTAHSPRVRAGGKSALPKPQPDRPKWGVGADGPPPRTGGRAASEDRNTRELWGVKLKSAYAPRLDLPDVVLPGDCATARVILDRIDRLLSMLDGQWTDGERKRLRDMRRAWHRRSQGRDLKFKLTGWTRLPVRTGRRFDDKVQAAALEGKVEEFRTWLDMEVAKYHR